jgi:acylphosphatase
VEPQSNPVADFDPSRAPFSSLTVTHAQALVESHVCNPWGEAAVEAEHRARRYFISGMVQGVGYRYFAQRAAQRLGVAGYTRNLRDGRVEVYAIGTDAMLASLRAELLLGPRMASVSSVAEEEGPLKSEYANEFSIEHGLH